MAFHMLLKSSITEIHLSHFSWIWCLRVHMNVGGTITHGHVWKPEIDIQMLFSVISPSYILIQFLPWIWHSTIWLESLNSYPLPLSMVCLFLHPPHRGYSHIQQCMQFLKVWTRIHMCLSFRFAPPPPTEVMRNGDPANTLTEKFGLGRSCTLTEMHQQQPPKAAHFTV